MFSPCRSSAVALVLLTAAGGCTKISSPPVRAPAHAPPLAVEPTGVEVSGLYPGGRAPSPPDPRAVAFAGDPEHIAAGKRYFTWYNCNGCHFSGGGGIGPPLMDDAWIYGGRVDQIFRSIADGRPNGMPTWRGKIPDAQIWEIAAYVKSLSSPEHLRQAAMPKTPLEPATLSGPHLVPKTL